MFTILEIDGWTDGWMDGWMGGWMDGWIDRYNHLFSYGILSNENIQTIKIC